MLVRILTSLVLVVLLARVSLGLKCYLCSDVIYSADTPESQTDTRWRDDGRCGPGFQINPNLTQSEDAECNPDAGSECCSSDGWCGSTSHHCCSECVKYMRSFSDFDLPACDHDDFDKTFGECEEFDDVCEVVKIATNTTAAEIDRYMTIRRCGQQDTDPCLKYTTAGHSCLYSSQCQKGRCNSAVAAGWQALGLVAAMMLL